MSRSTSQVNSNAPVGGRYRIIRQLGAGGFGRTFLAEDIHLPGFPRCVVKQLKPKFADATTLQMARRCFHTEAEVLYHLGSHDQIPRLLAHFEEQEEFYLAQEFVHGDPMTKELVKGKAWSQGRAIALIRDILTVLSFVHQQQVIHRDIKPSNLMRRKRDGRIVLIDFGAVKQVSTAVVNPENGQTNLTIAIGTHGYMPNEQIAGKPRYSSDVYAVGSIAIQALTGKSPRHIADDERGELAWHHLAPHVSRELLELVDQMVRYDFRERYETAADALVALNQLPAHLLNLATDLSPQEVPWPETPVDITNVLSYGAIHGSASELTLPEVELVAANEADDATDGASTDLMQSEETPLLPVLTQLTTLEPLDTHFEDLDTHLEGSNIQLGRGNTDVDAATALDLEPRAIRPISRPPAPQRGVAVGVMVMGAILVVLTTLLPELIKDGAETGLKQRLATLSLMSQGSAIAPVQSGLHAALLKLPSPSQQKAQSLVHQGDQLRATSKNAEALAAYDQAIALQSEYPEAYWGRCDALNKLNRPAEAIAACNEALAYRPYYAEAVYGKGNAYRQQKQWYEALDLYERATRYKPDLADAWIQRGVVLQQLGRSMEAIAALDKGLALQQNSPEGWAARGQALWNLRRFNDAVTAMDKALALQPNQPPVQQLRQQARAKLGH